MAWSPGSGEWGSGEPALPSPNSPSEWGAGEPPPSPIFVCIDPVQVVEPTPPLVSHYVYVLQSINYPNKFYIGYTIDPDRRLLQHNGKLAGGAQRTKKWGPWQRLCIIAGFTDNHQALRFEYRLQRIRKKSSATRLEHVISIITTLVGKLDGSSKPVGQSSYKSRRKYQVNRVPTSWPHLTINWISNYTNSGWTQVGYVSHLNVTNRYYQL